MVRYNTCSARRANLRVLTLTILNIRSFSLPVSKNWDKKRSVAYNLASMGLVADANKTLGIPKSAEEMGLPMVMENDNTGQVDTSKASEVIGQLEEEANKAPAKNFKFGSELTKFIVYMLEKYGDDYAVRVRDSRLC